MKHRFFALAEFRIAGAALHADTHVSSIRQRQPAIERMIDVVGPANDVEVGRSIILPVIDVANHGDGLSAPSMNSGRAGSAGLLWTRNISEERASASQLVLMLMMVPAREMALLQAEPSPSPRSCVRRSTRATGSTRACGGWPYRWAARSLHQPISEARRHQIAAADQIETSSHLLSSQRGQDSTDNAALRN